MVLNGNQNEFWGPNHPSLVVLKGSQRHWYGVFGSCSDRKKDPVAPSWVQIPDTGTALEPSRVRYREDGKRVARPNPQATQLQTRPASASLRSGAAHGGRRRCYLGPKLGRFFRRESPSIGFFVGWFG